MLAPRLIPCLLLKDSSLVKTVRYKEFQYVGDPVNTARIFNELEVDELCILDIRASIEKREPSYSLLQVLANECFMPLSYGGGIVNLEQAEKIFNLGFEKVILNSATFKSGKEVRRIIEEFGSQAVVGSVDVRKNLFGKYEAYSHSGTVKQRKDVVQWVSELEGMGFGEILLTNIDREGTWEGFDLDLIKSVSESSGIPVIAHGGAGSVDDIVAAIRTGGASAVALGSMVVFQKKGMGVLVNMPS